MKSGTKLTQIKIVYEKKFRIFNSKHKFRWNIREKKQMIENRLKQAGIFYELKDDKAFVLLSK
jgi:hypothetical protein